MTEVVLTIVAVFGLVMGSAGVVAQFRVSRNTGAISAYRESASGWESLTRAKDAEITELDARLAAANAKIVTLNAQIETLNARMLAVENIVTGKTLIEALGRDVAAGHDMVIAKLDAIQSGLAAHFAGGAS